MHSNLVKESRGDGLILVAKDRLLDLDRVARQDWVGTLNFELAQQEITADLVVRTRSHLDLGGVHN